jgi:acyl carrier protein
MTRGEIFNKLTGVFRDVFDDETITIGEETTAADIDGWDSLEHINLVAAAEEEFGVKFSMGEVVTLKNVGQMVDLISKKLSA